MPIRLSRTGPPVATARKKRPEAPGPQVIPPEAAASPKSPVPVPDAERRNGLLITPAQAAGLLSVTAKVLERWRGTGAGPAYVRLTSKTIRYRHEDIAAFIAGNTRANTAGA